jgi:pyrrolidone-carboxylate peptidase
VSFKSAVILSEAKDLLAFSFAEKADPSLVLGSACGRFRMTVHRVAVQNRRQAVIDPQTQNAL